MGKGLLYQTVSETTFDRPLAPKHGLSVPLHEGRFQSDGITLTASSPMDIMGMGASSTIVLKYVDLSTSGNMGFMFAPTDFSAFTVRLDSNVITPVGFSYFFSVLEGQDLTLTLTAATVSVLPGTPGMPTTNTVTIINFTPPIAVPEPSTYAAIVGTFGLGLAIARRRRNA